MNNLSEKETIEKYSQFNVKQLRKDYNDFWISFIFFIVPLIGMYCIFHFVNHNSNWIGIGFILGIWALYGFYLVTRPLIIRIFIPLLLSFLAVIAIFIKGIQYVFALVGEYIEKKIEKDDI
jgi:succinate-acetate transporter protein